MTIDRGSRLVKWAYWLEKEDIPRQTSLCEIFWRTVLMTPFKAFTLVTLVSVFFGVGLCAAAIVTYIVFTLLVMQPVVALVVLAIFSVALLLATWAFHWMRVDVEEFAERIHEAALVQGALAVKRGICPIVTIQ